MADRFSVHGIDCTSRHNYGKCDCGLEQAIAQLRALLKEVVTPTAISVETLTDEKWQMRARAAITRIGS